jgi:hypothetical protein
MQGILAPRAPRLVWIYHVREENIENITGEQILVAAFVPDSRDLFPVLDLSLLFFDFTEAMVEANV